MAKALIDEIRMLRNLRQVSTVAKIIRVYETKQEFKIIYEYVQESLSVKDLIEKKGYKMSAMDAKILTAQMLLVLDFMDRRNLVHRNISPEHILLAEPAAI